MIEVRKSRDRRAWPRRGLLGSVSTLAMVGTALVVAHPAFAADTDITSLTVTSDRDETASPGPGRRLDVTVHPKAADNSAATTGFDHFTVSAVLGSSTITTCSIDDADDPLTCTLTPLVAGTPYKIVAKAMSAADEVSLVATGTLLATAGTTTTPRLTPPDDNSVIATATGTSGDVKVEWTPDSNVGGSIVDHYTATAYLGGSTSQGTCSTDDGTTDNCTIHGLVDGATYKFKVVANHAQTVADSLATDPTGVATASAAPGIGSGAVTGVIATVDNASGDAIVSWAPPSDADDDTTYVAEVALTDGTALANGEACAATSGSPATVPLTTCSDLQTNTEYDISVSSLKSGVLSTAVTTTVKPVAALPAAPQDPEVDGGDTEAMVSWTAPDDNGVTVRGYRAVAAASSAPTVPVASCTTTGLTCTIMGLTNGTSYDTTVVSYGTTGAQSGAFPGVATDPAAVVPAVVPKPDPPVVETPADEDVTSNSAVIAWTAADPISGAPVVYYTATATPTTSGAAAQDASDPSCTVAAPATTCPITGLLPGTEYTVTVVAYASATVFSTAASTTITTKGSSVPSGGGTMTGPVVTNRDGLSQMFARGGDNNLYTNVRDANGEWGQWAPLGGLIGSEPVAVLNGSGSTARLQVFVLGFADHAVWFRLQTADGTGWGPWTHVDGSKYISTISTQKNLNGTVQVFGRGSDGNLYYSVQTTATDPGTWQNWVSLGGIIASEPQVVQWVDGTLEVFAVGQGDGQIWHTIQGTPGDNTSWVWWSHVAPSAASHVSL